MTRPFADLSCGLPGFLDEVRFGCVPIVWQFFVLRSVESDQLAVRRKVVIGDFGEVSEPIGFSWLRFTDLGAFFLQKVGSDPLNDKKIAVC